MKLVESGVKTYFGVEGAANVMCGTTKCTAGLCCGEASLKGSSKSMKLCQAPSASAFKKETRDGSIEEWTFKCTSKVVEEGAK